MTARRARKETEKAILNMQDSKFSDAVNDAIKEIEKRIANTVSIGDFKTVVYLNKLLKLDSIHDGRFSAYEKKLIFKQWQLATNMIYDHLKNNGYNFRNSPIDESLLISWEDA